MNKIFTLSYFINNYQKGSEIDALNSETEELLIAMNVEDYKPSQSSVDTILNFSRSYEVLESKKTGMIEMNLN